MNINFALLPLKLHYFFVYGGIAAVLPYLPVYSHEKLLISYEGIGFIYTLLPFICFIARTSSGTLADHLQAHRMIFLASIVICGLSFFSIGFISPLPTKANSNPASVQLECSSLHCIMSYAIVKKQCTTIKELDVKNDTAICEIKCHLMANDSKTLCSCWNISSECLEDNFSEFTINTYLNFSLNDATNALFPVSKLLINGTKVNYPRCDGTQIIANCMARCNSHSIMAFLGAPNQIPLSKYSEFLLNMQYWIYLILMCLAFAALSVWSVMSDTICFKLLGSETSKFGLQRVYGSISWGMIVIVTGLLIDMTSSFGDKNYTPAFILSLCVLSIDLIVASRLKVNGRDKRLQRSSIVGLLNDPRVIVFILSCFVVGVASGVLWTYQLLLVEETVHAWNCDFEFMKLLQGLIMAMGSFGGEIPLFFLSGYFINKLGYVNSMSLVMLVFGLRFILYSWISNPWLFLPIELLQGFTFGLFCAVMTSYASVIAPSGGEATVQGSVSAIQGLGVASGGSIGGMLFSAVGGASTFFYMGLFNCFFALLHILIQIIFDKMLHPQDLRSNADGYAPPVENVDKKELENIE